MPLLSRLASNIFLSCLWFLPASACGGGEEGARGTGGSSGAGGASTTGGAGGTAGIGGTSGTAGTGGAGGTAGIGGAGGTAGIGGAGGTAGTGGASGTAGIGGAGGTGGTGGTGGIDPNSVEVRVDLSVLSGALVEVHTLATLGDTPAVTTATGSGDLASAGRFGIASSFVAANGLFVVTVTGGSALDVDNDGALDLTPTPNLGSLHALLTREQIQRGNASVSIASEALYQRVRHFLAAAFDEAELRRQLDLWATALLSADIDGDGDQDADDIAVFASAADLSALHDSAEFTTFAQQVLAGGVVDRGALLGKTTPRAPVRVDTVDAAVAGSAHTGAAVSGDLVLSASGSFARLYRHDPGATPPLQLLASMPVNGATALDVAFRGDTAFVFSYTELASYDIGTPASPMLLDALSLNATPFAKMALVGNYAYVATGSGLTVIDTTDPANLTELPAVTHPAADLTAVDATEQTLFASSLTSVQVFDIATDPSQPIFQGATATTNGAHIIALSDTQAMIGELDRLFYIDATNPAAPVPRGEFDLPFSSGSISDIQRRGDLAFISNGIDQVRVLDIRTPETVRPSFTVSLNATDVGTAIANDQGLFAFSDAGVEVFEADPLAPPESLLGSTGYLLAQANSVALSGNLAYVGTGLGMTVVDVTDPLAPTVRGSEDFAPSMSIAASGSTVFVGADDLRIIDASDPDDPSTPVTFASGESFWRTMAISGDTLFAVVNTTLRSFDVSAPAAPVELDDLPVGSVGPLDMLLDGDYLYVPDSQSADGNLRVISVIDPGNLLEAGAAPIASASCGRESERPQAVALAGSIAYVAAFNNFRTGSCFQVIDVSNPAAPVLLSDLLLEIDSFDIAVSHGYVYIAGTKDIAPPRADILVLDVQDPTEPLVWGVLPTPGRIQRLQVRDGLIYVADYEGGLQVMRAAARAVP